VEAEGFDLIVMGRPEGQGCYCAANSLLTEFVERLSENYPYMWSIMKPAWSISAV
jgi:CO dehydrogenase maturation factor